MNKLYKVVTNSGLELYSKQTLSFLECKLQLNLNDIVNAGSLSVGQRLPRQIKIKFSEEIEHFLYEKSNGNNYYVFLEREE